MLTSGEARRRVWQIWAHQANVILCHSESLSTTGNPAIFTAPNRLKTQCTPLTESLCVISAGVNANGCPVKARGTARE